MTDFIASLLKALYGDFGLSLRVKTHDLTGLDWQRRRLYTVTLLNVLPLKNLFRSLVLPIVGFDSRCCKACCKALRVAGAMFLFFFFLTMCIADVLLVFNIMLGVIRIFFILIYSFYRKNRKGYV